MRATRHAAAAATNDQLLTEFVGAAHEWLLVGRTTGCYTSSSSTTTTTTAHGGGAADEEGSQRGGRREDEPHQGRYEAPIRGPRGVGHSGPMAQARGAHDGERDDDERKAQRAGQRDLLPAAHLHLPDNAYGECED